MNLKKRNKIDKRGEKGTYEHLKKENLQKGLARTFTSSVVFSFFICFLRVVILNPHPIGISEDWI